MNDIILSTVYIITLIIAGLSVFSSLLVFKNNDKKWFRAYLAIVICIAIGFLVNLTFQLIKNYSRLSELLENARIILLSFTYIFNTYFYLLLFYTICRKPQPEKIKRLLEISREFSGIIKWFFFIFSFTGFLLCAVFLFGMHQNYFNLINSIYIVICLIIDLLFILNSKELTEHIDNNLNLVIFTFIGLKLLYYLSFFVQYLLGIQDVVLPSIVIYLIFNLLIFTSNLYYSLKNIPRRNTISVSRENLHFFFESGSFTPTQKKVLEYFNDGLSNREIAEKLACEIRTVETHFRNIYKKCHVNSRYDLINLINSYRDMSSRE